RSFGATDKNLSRWYSYNPKGSQHAVLADAVYQCCSALIDNGFGFERICPGGIVHLAPAQWRVEYAGELQLCMGSHLMLIVLVEHVQRAGFNRKYFAAREHFDFAVAADAIHGVKVAFIMHGGFCAGAHRGDVKRKSDHVVLEQQSHAVPGFCFYTARSLLRLLQGSHYHDLFLSSVRGTRIRC